LPVPAYNEFNKLIDSLNSIGTEARAPYKVVAFPPAEFLPQDWPVQPGSYRVFSPTRSIAIALLKGVSVEALLDIDLSTVAIAGTITTENLGVEHLVKNVIANPYIRHLVVFGGEIQGHLPGDALLMLHTHGLDSKGRIVSAKGARPILKNIMLQEAEHFRSQITISELIGKVAPDALATRLDEVNKLAMPPYSSGLRIDLVESRRAEPARRLTFDKAGYFVIMVMHGREQPLVVEHYSNDGVLRNVIEGSDTASICATIVEMQLVSQLDHAAYLGRELARAELSMGSPMRYVQDKAQGHSERCDECG
jgi:tetrahydromethanopterin S-methyltransferase subunit A